ncbi:restriction endonuclease [Sorangium sp. So ce216]
MSTSTVPLPAAFFHEVLHELAKHPDGMRRRDLYAAVADAMNLSPTQRAERLPSGTHLRYRHRIGWSLNLLKNAGLVQSSAPGMWCTTAEGQRILAENPDAFSDETVRAITRDARAATLLVDHEEPDADPNRDSGQVLQQAPEERIDAALNEMRRAVAVDLLERIGQAPPAFFEDLVLDLLHALGYGTSADDLERVGASGDGGIDGIISLDKLGFEKVYVQAKRWQGSVGRPDVQGFFGALAGRRAKKGVFITTSTFTKEALAFGAQVSDTVVLIDGARLTQLMIDHGVAVTHYRVLRLPRVDGDYFESS